MTTLSTMPVSASKLVLSRETLRQIVPSVFAENPHVKVSSRYRFMPTIEIVDMLADRGFYPVKAAQSSTRSEGRGDFMKHLLRFRHVDHLGDIREVGQEIPELVLFNSHDLSAAYRFMSGIFRLVCENGLVVASENFGSVHVKHVGSDDLADRVIEATCQIVDAAPKALETVNEWKSIPLSAPEQLAFARAAAEIVGDEKVSPKSYLDSFRQSDKPAPDGTRDLWKTFNTVQENTIKGGIRGRNAETRRRFTTRAVKSVDKDVKLNKALWTLAEEMAKLAK